MNIRTGLAVIGAISLGRMVLRFAARSYENRLVREQLLGELQAVTKVCADLLEEVNKEQDTDG